MTRSIKRSENREVVEVFFTRQTYDIRRPRHNQENDTALERADICTGIRATERMDITYATKKIQR